MKKGHYDRQLNNTRQEIDRQRMAARFPALQAMLGNTPPSQKEIFQILIGEIGPETGWPYPPQDENRRYSTVDRRHATSTGVSRIRTGG